MSTWDTPQLERSYSDPDCGCPVEEWTLNGVDLIIHFEDAGKVDVFAEAGDWDCDFSLVAADIQAGRESAFAWVRRLPGEGELTA